MYCHRATRAHNTILVNGIGQRIGTEGYGWIPRYYVGEKIGYVLGDASNAYGKVISKSWLARAKKEEVSFSPEAGWDDVKLKTFRRHIVELGKTGFTFTLCSTNSMYNVFGVVLDNPEATDRYGTGRSTKVNSSYKVRAVLTF